MRPGPALQDTASINVIIVVILPCGLLSVSGQWGCGTRCWPRINKRLVHKPGFLPIRTLSSNGLCYNYVDMYFVKVLKQDIYN